MRGLDLFSGIGGITKALEGYVRPIAYCEIEPYARGVLLSRMHSGDLPLAPIWDDVLTLRGAMLPQVDIIYGGFPCQDISCAGRGKGLGGKRSGLFFQILRLAEEVKPSFIFLENVSAIRRRGLGIVLRELTSIGYDCRWCMLSAADVGANHKRERWFLLAHTTRKQNSGISINDSSVAYSEPKGKFGRGSIRKSMAYTSRESGAQENTSISTVGESGDTWEDDSRSNGRTPPRNDWWLSEPNVGRVVDGVPRRVDRLQALGNAVVPAQAREAFERLMGLK